MPQNDSELYFWLYLKNAPIPLILTLYIFYMFDFCCIVRPIILIVSKFNNFVKVGYFNVPQDEICRCFACCFFHISGPSRNERWVVIHTRLNSTCWKINFYSELLTKSLTLPDGLLVFCIMLYCIMFMKCHCKLQWFNFQSKRSISTKPRSRRCHTRNSMDLDVVVLRILLFSHAGKQNK